MIHKYKLRGYNIVLDVNSGAIHVVDDITYSLLEGLNDNPTEEEMNKAAESLSGKFSYEEIAESISEIKELIQEGQLFSEDDYSKFSDMMVKSPVKAMCLHIAHDCNLRCEYCFAGKGDYEEGRMIMSPEIGKKAIDYLLHHSKGRHNLELDFFGGEPLMNFKAVKEVVEYARSKEAEHDKTFRFTITTNGLLLDEDKINFINKEMSNVVLSIDGRKSVNDKVRARVDGRGCYDTIMPKFIDLVDKRGHDNYYVRGTFTKYNKDFAEDVLHLNSLGFKQISVEPVVSDPKYPYSLTDEDLPEIFDEYERLADIIIDREKNGDAFNFFHYMLDLEQGPCAIKRLRGCGCGNEYVAVTPEGDVYPCHQFVGMDGWKIGSVNDLSIDENVKAEFAKANVYGKEECRDCWAKFYCSGGCNANNFQYAGDILKPHKLACETEKKRLECAIMIKAALS